MKQRESTSTSRLWGFPSVRHASGSNSTRADYSPSIYGARGTFDGVYGGFGEAVFIEARETLRPLELFEFLITILSLIIFSSRTLTLEVLCKINNFFLVKKEKKMFLHLF